MTSVYLSCRVSGKTMSFVANLPDELTQAQIVHIKGTLCKDKGFHCGNPIQNCRFLKSNVAITNAIDGQVVMREKI